MRRVLGLATAAAALAVMASAVAADEISGAVEGLDKTAHTFVVGGKPFALSEGASGDVTIDDLKDGDQVKIEYVQNQGSEPNNVMKIEKE